MNTRLVLLGVLGLLLAGTGGRAGTAWGDLTNYTEYVRGTQQTFKSDLENGTDPNRILTNDLLQTSLTSAVLAGTYQGSVGVLYDGKNGGDSTLADMVWPGNDTLSSTWTVTFTLNTTVNTAGYNLTAISSYAAWPETRTSQRYDVQYQTPSDPVGTWRSLANIDFFGASTGTGSSRVTIANTTADAYIAENVSALKFSIYYPHHGNSSSTRGFDATTYREFDVTGVAAAVPEPSAGTLVCLGLLGTLALVRRRR